MTDLPCICGHAKDEHSSGAAGCLGVVAVNHPGDLFCACFGYDPGPPF